MFKKKIKLALDLSEKCPETLTGRLYKTFERFVDLAPWEVIHGETLFAIRLPDREEVQYFSVTGAAGDYYALLLFRGEEELQHYAKTILNDYQGYPGEFAAKAQYMMFDLVRIDEMNQGDHRRLKDAGVATRSHGLYPSVGLKMKGYAFVDVDDATLEWHLPVFEASVRYLEDFLKMRADSPIETDNLQAVHCRTIRENGDSEDHTLDALEAMIAYDEVVNAESEPLENLITPAAIKKIKKRMPLGEAVWQLGGFYFSGQVEDDGITYFPIVYVVIEESSELVLDHVMVRPEKSVGKAADLLVRMMKKHKERPAAITLAEDSALEGIEVMLDALEITYYWDEEPEPFCEVREKMNRKATMGLGEEMF